MSRIGKLPVTIPAGVTVNVKDNVVTVKGKLGELKQEVNRDITVEVKEGKVLVTRPTDHKRHRAMHGMYRAIINNMIKGVSTGFELKQELVGVGYRAQATGQVLELSLGHSHSIMMQLPAEVKIETLTEKKANPIITLRSADRQLLGQVAAKLRSFREPEPYKGKGVKFVDEVLRRKAGKTSSK